MRMIPAPITKSRRRPANGLGVDTGRAVSQASAVRFGPKNRPSKAAKSAPARLTIRTPPRRAVTWVLSLRAGESRSKRKSRWTVPVAGSLPAWLTTTTASLKAPTRCHSMTASVSDHAGVRGMAIRWDPPDPLISITAANRSRSEASALTPIWATSMFSVPIGDGKFLAQTPTAVPTGSEKSSLKTSRPTTGSTTRARFALPAPTLKVPCSAAAVRRTADSGSAFELG